MQTFGSISAVICYTQCRMHIFVDWAATQKAEVLLLCLFMNTTNLTFALIMFLLIVFRFDKSYKKVDTELAIHN